MRLPRLLWQLGGEWQATAMVAQQHLGGGNENCSAETPFVSPLCQDRSLDGIYHNPWVLVLCCMWARPFLSLVLMPAALQLSPSATNNH